MEEMNAQEIIEYIGNADKKTPVRVFIKGSLTDLSVPESIKGFLENHTGILFGDWQDVEPFIQQHLDVIKDYVVEMIREIQLFRYLI
ncbi:2,3,4,5-tetrahydropyridine-2,6-dicarboxylate N-acetyltransferase [Lentilactobacillus kosonis]|uniref:2,3,4,5-tetrahydropyridine-2,6-dicarboxylate N-acetyltransferase n=1 Tax=Lentilactobacillus kosonis TaxID=2810561 RepID=A0A401FM93_9LACO|nr:2,3,4,5-tetrahydropyridine-2,6-dicarboxylate N-acetyltransferase [Lentilactobacillus kosonis]